jgi:CRISPR-associated protein Cmr2
MKHLQPHKLSPNLQAERKNNHEVWVHPFEILTIGGDDVMLIVPADKALEIAKTIGEEFEKILLDKYKSEKSYTLKEVHRYRSQENISTNNQCKLSMSTGVLITADNTPIYYTQKLTEQLLKSAKKLAKELKKSHYSGGTVDFLVMKSLTMISSSVNDFRSEGLIKSRQGKPKLKLYAAPYTLHELGGLLKTLQALKNSDFPKSQIYQIRSLLERGKHTAILNYRYFKVRLANKKAQDLLESEFEKVWCQPKDEKNNGSLAPWMSLIETEEETKSKNSQGSNKKNKDENEHESNKVTYETIWRDLVDLYPFTEKIESHPIFLQSEEKITKL